MPESIRDVFYQPSPWFSIQQPQSFIKIIADYMIDIYISLFAICPYVISLTW